MKISFESKWVIKHYDKCEKKFTTLTEPLPHKEALKIYNARTMNGTQYSNPSDGDYYKLEKIEQKLKIKKIKLKWT